VYLVLPIFDTIFDAMQSKLSLKSIADRFKLRREKEPYNLVHKSISASAVAEGTNLWILFFAILIASLGLNVNSTAVVIGAMLISPLIGPIVGLGFGVATNDLKLIKISFSSYLLSTLVGLVASTIYFLLTPIDTAQSEILARTYPTIYDVLIALFGGFAGVLAISSKQKGNVIPGVAIATAIIPPLCTAGFGIANLEWTYFLGALYLFIINSVFIFAATIITTYFLKYPKRSYDDPALEKREKRIVYTIIAITLVPSLYLGYSIVQKNKFETNAKRFIKTEVGFTDTYLLSEEISNQENSITLTFGGQKIKESDLELLKSKLPYYDLVKTELLVKYGFSFDNMDDNLFKRKQMSEALNEIATENKRLQHELDSIQIIKEKSSAVFTELKALYPDIEDAIIQPTSIKNDSTNQLESSYLVILTRTDRFRNENKNKIVNWLKIRLNCQRIEVIEKN